MPFHDDQPIQKYIPHISLESHLNLSIQTDSPSPYIDSNKTHSLPVTVSLAVAPLELTYRPPLDIVIVVEKSQEMTSTFFEATRLSINKVLSTLNGNDRLSLVFYDDFGYRVTPLNRMSEDNKEDIRSGLHSVYLSGGADLADGLGQGMEILRQRRYKNPTACVLVIGASSDVKSVGTLDFLLQKNMNENFYVHTFGCTGTENPVFQWIAQQKNGLFHQISSETELTAAFFEALSSVAQIQSHEAELYFFTNTRLLPESGVQNVYNDNATWSIPEKCYKVKLPYLTPGFKEEFRLEVAIPQLPKNAKTGEHTINILDVIYRVEALDSVIMKKENLQVNVYHDLNDESTADQEQGEEYTCFEDDSLSYRGFKHGEQTMASMEKVSKLVIVEELMIEANKLLHQNKAEEAKKVAARLRWEAQGLGMEFEVIIKNFLEKVYQSCRRDSFDGYLEC